MQNSIMNALLLVNCKTVKSHRVCKLYHRYFFQKWFSIISNNLALSLIKEKFDVSANLLISFSSFNIAVEAGQ